ncbi:MAG TPA: glycoside hydrolase family 15 protein [Dysgonamonadaceae bacterium]|nr:glycoside hydrolase family 15 protein [Dysgonamonadaceae bacterium]PLB85582.1 glycoside hydrolase family 15 protein [Dysgonamonadaceae bacterium]HOM62901.1 glycoside hydrolase family 15 protein [Dysgonamonadaceae bacterium]HOV35470.1 glycoside hydrolase family 15 protein [Dysgonamonadaceae bacterium]HPD42732.1 glycoside hydrolase family 15 protein [Dysgonamonadaceae bacterium]
MNNLDYGVIGNCRTAALISKEGSIDWFCLPDFDSPSVFSKLLDENKGGSFSFEVSSDYAISQKYFKNTNILSTWYESEEGAFVVYDYMPRYRTIEQRYYLPPEIHRYLRVIRGKPRLSVRYDPKMNYAAESVVHEKYRDYIKTTSVVNDRNEIYLYSSVDFDTILNGEEFRLSSDEFFLLSYTQKLIPIDLERIHLDYERTKVYWLNWTNRSRKFLEYEDMINRSLLVIKLMSYHSTGAMIAALTTSLPESIGECRNWDYRFCWLRDASMSISSLVYMGHKNVAERFIGFVKNLLRSRDDVFQIMYGIRGERELTEVELTHLSGYENSYPVRIGNAAFTQIQNDSPGYLLDVIYKYYLYFPGTLDEIEEMWEIVRFIARSVSQTWQMPDHSIWEFRTRKLNFVFSKVMSWVAMDRATAIAELLHKNSYAELWKTESEKIKADIFEKGWKEEIQCFSQAYENNDYDSSLLLMHYYGFIDANDERFVKTVKSIRQHLQYKGLMYRYKSADDFGHPSSSFTVCNFWMIQALYAIGEKEESRRMFDSIVAYANHVGLYSEDFDFETGRLLGNFPQAYSHLAFINAATLFSEEKVVSKFIRP